MELVYLYVKDFGILKDASFNFSSKYHFSFDLEQWTLTATETDNPLPENFFSNNQSGVVKNISALIGSNGSGKTSVSRLLRKVFSKDVRGGQVECILVFESAGTFKVFNSVLPPCDSGDEVFENLNEVVAHSNKWNILKLKKAFKTTTNTTFIDPFSENWQNILLDLFESNSALALKMDVTIKFKFQFVALTTLLYKMSQCESTHFVYSSNFYDPNHLLGPARNSITNYSSHDLSTSALLHCDYSNRRMISNSQVIKENSMLDSHTIEELTRNVLFFGALNRSQELAPEDLSLPMTKTLYISFKKVSFDEIWQTLSGLEQSQSQTGELTDHPLDRLEEVFSDYEKALRSGKSLNGYGKRSILLSLEKLIIYNGLYEHLRDISSQRAYGKILTTVNSALDSFRDQGFSNFYEFFTLPFFKKMNNLYSFVNDLGADMFYLPQNKLFFELNEEDGLNNALKFISLCEPLLYLNDYLEFDWHPTLSTGEYSLYNIYSRIYDLVKHSDFSIQDKEEVAKRHLILFFDEIETTVHPEVQRKLVKSLITFCETFLSGLTVQLIFASHSPILLSDIPKSTVTFMKKIKPDDTGFDIKRNDGMAYLEVNKKGADAETFGANIHSLYRHSFFLERGAMGAFAEGKINGLIKDIEGFNSNSDLADLESRIGMVGEPVIKKVLEDQLKAKIIAHHDVGKLEEYIAQLQDRVKTLKAFECSEEAE